MGSSLSPARWTRPRPAWWGWPWWGWGARWGGPGTWTPGTRCLSSRSLVTWRRWQVTRWWDNTQTPRIVPSVTIKVPHSAPPRCLSTRSCSLSPPTSWPRSGGSGWTCLRLGAGVWRWGNSDSGPGSRPSTCLTQRPGSTCCYTGGGRSASGTSTPSTPSSATGSRSGSCDTFIIKYRKQSHQNTTNQKHGPEVALVSYICRTWLIVRLQYNPRYLDSMDKMLKNEYTSACVKK